MAQTNREKDMFYVQQLHHCEPDRNFGIHIKRALFETQHC